MFDPRIINDLKVTCLIFIRTIVQKERTNELNHDKKIQFIIKLILNKVWVKNHWQT